MNKFKVINSFIGATKYTAEKGLCKVGLRKMPTTVPQRVLPNEVPQSVMEALSVPSKAVKVSEEEIQRLRTSCPTLSANDIMKDAVKEAIGNKVKSNKLYNFLRYFRKLEKQEISSPIVGTPTSHTISELPTDVATSLFPARPVNRYVYVS